MGLLDSHFTILPGDPFSYFKMGTICEFIGFTYFIVLLIKMKVTIADNLELQYVQNRHELMLTSEKLQKEIQRSSTNSGLEKTDILGVFKLLENSLSNESDWQDFKSKFEKLNPNFHNNLISKHQNLSKSEIRLLTLIKINYSQKEIAGILNIEPDSVKKAKNRVRKKLEISSAVQLQDYLLKF